MWTLGIFGRAGERRKTAQMEIEKKPSPLGGNIRL